MNWAGCYLMVGVGAYLHAWAATKSHPRNATVLSLLRGVLAFIFWPITLYILWEPKR